MIESRKEITTGVPNATFVKLCVEHGVEFLVIGGAAVRHYGCRSDKDGVREIDLLVKPSPENANRIMNVLRAAGLQGEFTVHALQKPNKRLPIKQDNYQLDILTPLREWSYSDIQSRAEDGSLNSTVVRIVSKDDLIKMKENAVTKYEAEAEKHRTDLKCLKTR